ncbi:hypothetical protein FF38_08569 [Lucilia cuprina]|uniref:Uncharacterized protein n=1 Tax=Lucilia cuprina TaxID=7375 RepID=A0A0L0C2E4_LUCCU|nr:hypothetical protein FF38_08569 [Lucilia cuprina]
MDVLPNDDELLLMELERRDGIYSFIFHELEANKLQTEEQHKIKESNKNLMFNEHLIKWELKSEITTKNTPLLSTTLNSSQPHAKTDECIKNSTTIFNNSWHRMQATKSLNSNLPYQVHFSAPAYPSFQQVCSLRSLNVRRAKSPFSHIHTTLVRNRRHELKETAEYKNYMDDISKIADLRDLFPLDPDVHAPFAEDSENVRNSKSSRFMIKGSQFLK